MNQCIGNDRHGGVMTGKEHKVEFVDDGLSVERLALLVARTQQTGEHVVSGICILLDALSFDQPSNLLDNLHQPLNHLAQQQVGAAKSPSVQMSKS
jgi:hypothetical protein